MANEKEIKLTPPEGWVIDEEKSSLKDCKIVYKEKKKETFNDALTHCKGDWAIAQYGLSKSLASKVSALIKLAIVAIS